MNETHYLGADGYLRFPDDEIQLPVKELQPWQRGKVYQIWKNSFSPRDNTFYVEASASNFPLLHIQAFPNPVNKFYEDNHKQIADNKIWLQTNRLFTEDLYDGQEAHDRILEVTSVILDVLKDGLSQTDLDNLIRFQLAAIAPSRHFTIRRPNNYHEKGGPKYRPESAPVETTEALIQYANFNNYEVSIPYNIALALVVISGIDNPLTDKAIVTPEDLAVYAEARGLRFDANALHESLNRMATPEMRKLLIDKGILDNSRLMEFDEAWAFWAMSTALMAQQESTNKKLKLPFIQHKIPELYPDTDVMGVMFKYIGEYFKLLPRVVKGNSVLGVMDIDRALTGYLNYAAAVLQNSIDNQLLSVTAAREKLNTIMNQYVPIFTDIKRGFRRQPHLLYPGQSPLSNDDPGIYNIHSIWNEIREYGANLPQRHMGYGKKIKILFGND